ncbi:hypothetical protein Patl1_33739 [Pistacia atlantica]|uniref:Uncharacterized protein n=1 Tax=Pistacia atlantica TaxID=434234 RepID=A0ACC0ZR37_9ROSI|nr:hypothetical protein Patl1_33739 [Pistacia atlantica]
MLALQELEIRCCKHLDIPIGLENVTSLKELNLTSMKKDFVDRIRRSVGENVVVIENNWNFQPLFRLDLDEEEDDDGGFYSRNKKSVEGMAAKVIGFPQPRLTNGSKFSGQPQEVHSQTWIKVVVWSAYLLAEL